MKIPLVVIADRVAEQLQRDRTTISVQTYDQMWEIRTVCVSSRCNLAVRVILRLKAAEEISPRNKVKTCARDRYEEVSLVDFTVGTFRNRPHRQHERIGESGMT